MVKTGAKASVFVFYSVSVKSEKGRLCIGNGLCDTPGGKDITKKRKRRKTKGFRTFKCKFLQKKFQKS